MAFEGIQPVFKHVPPSKSRSISATFAPNTAAARAASTPAGPPPNTARSYLCRGRGFRHSVAGAGSASGVLALSDNVGVNRPDFIFEHYSNIRAIRPGI